jgi:hypothetical protein
MVGRQLKMKIPDFMGHHSWALSLAAINNLRLGHFEFGQKGQIVRNHRTPNILFKASPFRPGSSGLGINRAGSAGFPRSIRPNPPLIP